MKLETLFLDAGGVLVLPNWDRVADTLGDHGIQVRGADLRAHSPRVMHELDRPDRPDANDDDSRGLFLFYRVLELAGIERSEGTAAGLVEVRRYHDEHNIWEIVPPGVPAALERLRSEGLRLVVVSNANGTLERMLERQGLRHYFDVVIDSAVVGVEKPDPRIFEIAIARSSVDPATTVHVGDLVEVDVVGARRSGLGAALIDNADLYPQIDCPRFRSLAELAKRVDELG